MTSKNTARSRARAALLVPLAAGLLWLTAVAAPVGAAATYRDCSKLEWAARADLHRCDLADSTIIGMDLQRINVARSDLSRVDGGCDPDMPRTNLAGARFYRAIAVDALLCDAILDGADLHGTDFTNASFEDASFHHANVSRSTLDGATAGFARFTDANLSNASWIGGSATGARFDGADLHRIDFRGTSLRSATFIGSDLRYARFGGADLTNADLTGATWRRATGLGSATFSNTTCPDGTNSDANGGTCIGH